MASPEQTPAVRPRRLRNLPAQDKPNGPIAQLPPMPENRRRYIEAVEEHNAARTRLFSEMEALDPGVREWTRQIDALVEVHSLGLGYEATAANGVIVTLRHLRQVRGDLTARLDVTRWGNHLFNSRFNVSSAPARRSTAVELERHPAGKEVDWREVLEQVCLKVLDADQVGEPSEIVGDRPMAEAPPRVIDPFLPEAVTLVWAPQGSGKSTFAVAVAVSLELFAEVIPGWHPREERRVLVLDWEASPAEWNDRVIRVAAGVGEEPPRLRYRRCRTPLADQVEQLAEEIDRHSIGFLVVDSFEKAAGAMVDGSTYEDKAARTFAALDRLARPALILDHVAGEDLRGGTSRVTPKSIGSVLKGAWARATYDLKREPTSTESRTELVLHNVKLNDAAKLPPYEFVIESEGDRGPIRFEHSALTSPELLASLSQQEQLWRHLAEGPKGTKELADLIGVSDAQVRAIVSRHARRFVTVPGVGVARVQPE